MLTDVIAYLRCPLCAGGLSPAGSSLRCPSGHGFDVARQGYVNLLAGTSPPGGDTAEMVRARADVLAAGHLGFLAEALAGAAAAAVAGMPGPQATRSSGRPSGLVVDIGAGTGYYLARVLSRLPDRLGLALDAAKPAARRSARAHPRAAAVVCDAWRSLPVADRVADLVLDVFAPRNGPEFHRILRPAGALLVVTPRPEHLAELTGALGLVRVDPDKERRLAAALGNWFRPVAGRRHARRLALSRADAERFIMMGPSAWHVDRPALTRHLAGLVEPIHTTADVDLRVFAPR